VHQLLDGLLLAVDGQTLAQFGVEHDFRALPEFLAELNDLLVGEFDLHLVLLAGVVVAVLLLGVLGHLAVLLLDFLDELLLVALVQTDLSRTADECTHGLGHGSACDGVLGHGHFVDLAVDDRHSVADSIPHVEHSPGGLARRKE